MTTQHHDKRVANIAVHVEHNFRVSWLTQVWGAVGQAYIDASRLPKVRSRFLHEYFSERFANA